MDRWLLGSVGYSGKGTESFDVLKGDQELDVRTTTYGPETDQSQHAKSVNNIIKCGIDDSGSQLVYTTHTYKTKRNIYLQKIICKKCCLCNVS